MATSKVSLKLLIDRKSQKVLFAEAGKEFVDFLFNLLVLPLGTITRLSLSLCNEKMVGSLGNLYNSIEAISESYLIKENVTREALLRPKSFGSLAQVPLLPDHASVSRKFYFCSVKYYHYFVADDPKTLCPTCNGNMSQELVFVPKSNTQVVTGANNAEVGFVKGVVTYMVMDDLVVKPMSTISSIAMLNSFNIKEIGELQEKVVYVDMDQGVKLLKASQHSKMVLTSVFLGRW